MAHGIKLHVWGDYALFTRPEMKVERVSYDVMTPSAARGILEAIYWKPQFRWNILSIEVLRPIRFTNIRRNEVGNKMTVPSAAVMEGQPAALGFCVDEVDSQGKLKYRLQRASTLLRDVAYVIHAEVIIKDSAMERGGEKYPEYEAAGKHLAIFKRKAAAGQYRHHPCLGCREFPADFALLADDAPSPPSELPEADRNRTLGWMLHDIAYIEDKRGPIIESQQGQRLRAEPRFFNAEMKNGIITVPPLAASKA